MNYNSRKELQACIDGVRENAEITDAEVSRLMLALREEWEIHSDPVITYANIERLSRALTSQCMQGQGHESTLKTLWNFLEVADEP